MPDWPAQDVRVNGVRLRCYRTGGEKPPLVLAHGFTDNALYWTRLITALAPEWDVIAYDARGHGDSDRAQGRFQDADRVGDLLGLIDALQLQRPGLLGHSMGAATVGLAAAERPELPRFVILEDPAWYAARPAQGRRVDREAWRAWVSRLQASPFEQAVELRRSEVAGWAEADVRLSARARQQFELELFDFYPPAEAPWESIVPLIACPLLLITGEVARGGVIAPEEARALAAAARHGRWTPIANAGHSIHFDQFEVFLDAVQAFLREVR